MMPRLAILALLLGICSPDDSLGNEAGSDGPALSSVKAGTLRLILEDFRSREKADVHSQTAGSPDDEKPADLLILPRIIVTERKLPELPAPIKEAPLDHFFRTGTIFETTRIRFWARGDKGLMLTFKF